jgi:hypothetical protein
MGDIYFKRESERNFSENKFVLPSYRMTVFFSKMEFHLFQNWKKEYLKHLSEFFSSLSPSLTSNYPMFSVMGCMPPTLCDLYIKVRRAQSM